MDPLVHGRQAEAERRPLAAVFLRLVAPAAVFSQLRCQHCQDDSAVERQSYPRPVALEVRPGGRQGS